MANNAIQVFDGTATTVLAITATLVTANFTTSGTATITEFDNSTDLWPAARASIRLDDGAAPWSAAPTVGTTLDLYMYPQDIGGGTTDHTIATATLVKGGLYVGSFGPLYAVDEDQPLSFSFSLAGIEKAKFALWNGSGVSIVYASGGHIVTIEGHTLTPSA